MDFQEITVNTDRLETEISDLSVKLNLVRLRMDEMFQEILELGAMWKGPANEAFHAQFVLDREEMENQCRLIADILDSMENAKNEYNSCESRVFDAVGSISV